MNNIIFIRHAESYANILKKNNKKNYLDRYYIDLSTLEYEKTLDINNRIFDTFLTKDGIINCLNKKKYIINDIYVLISPLIRVLLTTFFLFYDYFTEEENYKINIIIVNDFKEKFYYPTDLLENYEFSFHDKINDIKNNIINDIYFVKEINLDIIDINNKFNIFVNKLNIKEPIKNNYFDNDNYKIIFNNIKENIRICNIIKKKYYLNRLNEIIIKYNIYNKNIYVISHWGTINSIFNTDSINNLDEFILK
jgi:hypothetical protein